MDVHARRALGLAHDLAGLATAEELYPAALACLRALFPCDQAFWTRTDFAARRVVVRGDETCTPALTEALGALGDGHPGIQSYVADPADLSPRRISDVVDARTWRRSPIYDEAFAEFGPAHQLSMVVDVSSPHVGAGWTFTRSGHDFTDEELELAGHVLPVMTALERVLVDPGPCRPGPPDPLLTGREREVLVHLSHGLTAGAIARRHGTTERTVRKHLGAIYAKLGCHDRLVAVSVAREHGILPH